MPSLIWAIQIRSVTVTNKDLIEELYRTQYPAQVKIARGVLKGESKGEAEDVVQEAYCKALQYAESYDDSKGDIGGWFNTILYRAIYDYESPPSAITQLTGTDPDREESLTLSEDLLDKRDIFNRSMEGQTELIRQVSQLHLIEGITSIEVGKTLGISPENVRQIASRFKKEMREKYRQ